MYDSLTSLATRHQLHLDLPNLAARAGTHPLALLLLEVRDFQLWQERLTPLAADRLIQLAGATVKSCAPPDTYPARWDHCCFALLLPDTTAWQAEEIGEEIRYALSQTQLPAAFEAQQLKPDLICGAAAAAPVEPNALFREARAQLERARGSIFARLLREQREEAEQEAGYEAAAACLRLAESYLAHGDPYLRRHGQMTAGFCRQVGRALDLDSEALDQLTQAAAFADIAMKEAAGACLNKPGNLTLSEYRRVQRHVEFAVELGRALPLPEPVIHVLACHHEHLDGSGYPRGLSGWQIPLAGSVLGACGAYASMLLPRPFRPARRSSQAKAILAREAGTLWPEEVVRAIICEL